MEVFTPPHLRFVVRVEATERGDVDVQSVGGIDPACIDDVVTRSSITEIRPRINVKQVFAPEFAVR